MGSVRDRYASDCNSSVRKKARVWQSHEIKGLFVEEYKLEVPNFCTWLVPDYLGDFYSDLFIWQVWKLRVSFCHCCTDETAWFGSHGKAELKSTSCAERWASNVPCTLCFSNRPLSVFDLPSRFWPCFRVEFRANLDWADPMLCDFLAQIIAQKFRTTNVFYRCRCKPCKSGALVEITAHRYETQNCRKSTV